MNIKGKSKAGKIWRTGTLTYTTGGLLVLCFWLLWGDFPWAMRGRAVGPSATLLIKQLGVSDFLYGLIIIAFPNFTNIFLMPTISYISDRHRGRWGRRIPFLLFTTPFIVLGLYLIGLTHPFGNWLASMFPMLSMRGAKLTVFCIGWVMLDFGSTLSLSLYSALANDVVPKEVLGRFFALSRMVSLAAGMLFNWCLIDKVESHATAILFGVGTFYGIGLLSLCWKVKEGEYPPPAEVIAPSTEGASRLRTVTSRVASSTMTYLRQSFSLAYYRWYIVATAVALLVFTPINSFSIQYAKSLGIGMDKYGTYAVITFCISFASSFFLGSLSDRFHPLRTCMTVMTLYAILMLTSFVLIANPAYFGTLYVLQGVIAGCYYTLVASLGPRLLPRELYAQFTSARSIVFSIGIMVIGPTIGKVLDWIQDYRYVFLIGGSLALVAVLLYIKMYRNFLACGGDRNYQPPMPR